jgi:hypothetical protein
MADHQAVCGDNPVTLGLLELARVRPAAALGREEFPLVGDRAARDQSERCEEAGENFHRMMGTDAPAGVNDQPGQKNVDVKSREAKVSLPP